MSELRLQLSKFEVGPSWKVGNVRIAHTSHGLLLMVIPIYRVDTGRHMAADRSDAWIMRRATCPLGRQKQQTRKERGRLGLSCLLQGCPKLFHPYWMHVVLAKLKHCWWLWYTHVSPFINVLDPFQSFFPVYSYIMLILHAQNCGNTRFKRYTHTYIYVRMVRLDIEIRRQQKQPWQEHSITWWLASRQEIERKLGWIWHIYLWSFSWSSNKIGHVINIQNLLGAQAPDSCIQYIHIRLQFTPTFFAMAEHICVGKATLRPQKFFIVPWFRETRIQRELLRKVRVIEKRSETQDQLLLLLDPSACDYPI